MIGGLVARQAISAASGEAPSFVGRFRTNLCASEEIDALGVPCFVQWPGHLPVFFLLPPTRTAQYGNPLESPQQMRQIAHTHSPILTRPYSHAALPWRSSPGRANGRVSAVNSAS